MFGFTESHSPRMVRAGGDLKDHLVPTHCHEEDPWEFGLPVAELLEGSLGGDHILFNQPTLAAKGVFPPVCVISERGCSSSADGVSCCRQWSGTASLTASLPSGPEARQEGLEPAAAAVAALPNSTFSETKNDSSRNQA